MNNANNKWVAFVQKTSEIIIYGCAKRPFASLFL